MYMAFVWRLFYTICLRKILRVMKNDNYGEYTLYKRKINFVVIIYLFFYSNESLRRPVLQLRNQCQGRIYR